MEESRYEADIDDHSKAECIRNFRLTNAIKALKQGAQIGLVADAVGFSSHAYFASCFKADFSAMPSEFQQGLHQENWR